MNQLNATNHNSIRVPKLHSTPPPTDTTSLSGTPNIFKYPLSMRSLREFFKSYVHTRVHYVRVDSDSQYPKVKLLLI